MSHRSLDQAIWSVLWWICLLGAPAVLVGIELFHLPQLVTDYPQLETLCSGSERACRTASSNRRQIAIV